MHSTQIPPLSNTNLIPSWSLTWQLYKHCFLQMQHRATWRSFRTTTHSSTPYRWPTPNQHNLANWPDLGIIFDNDLKFNDHILDIVNRAYKRSNLIFRCFLSKDTNSLVRAYKTYVRPLLEYNSVVWSPSQIYHINSIEAVQRAFTKRLPAIKNLSHSQIYTYKPLNIDVWSLTSPLVSILSMAILLSNSMNSSPLHTVRLYVVTRKNWKCLYVKIIYHNIFSHPASSNHGILFHKT